jgi:hypothetical protein
LDVVSRDPDIVRYITFACLVVLLMGPRVDAAPQFVCFNVQPGDTSASLAFRLTNDSASQHASWFGVFDPSTARWVPKSAYGRLAPGWRACVVAAKFSHPRSGQPFAEPTPRVADPVVQPVGRVRMPPAGAPGVWEQLTAIIRAMGWWWYLLAGSAAVLIWAIADRHDERRLRLARDLERFGKTFVDEFARPLLETSNTAPPLRARLNALPRRRRLEIFLAPGEGRRYPNLSDHRKNLEYDVERVTSTLADPRFVPGNFAERGSWVVIPFHYDTTVNKAGSP